MNSLIKNKIKKKKYILHTLHWKQTC